MGGLVGRLFREGLSGLAGQVDLAHPGVYALMGSAAMLGGFTQMSIAIVVLLLEATHDYPLVAPLMLSVTFARITARALNHRAYDEHLILLKQVPYLEEELPAELDEENWLACELCEGIPTTSMLSRNMNVESLEWALSADVKREQFPVMDEGRLQGIVQRSHLKVLLHSRDNVSVDSQRTEVFSKVFAKVFASRKPKTEDEDDDGLDLERIVSKMTNRNEETGLPVHLLMDSTPHTIWEDTPIGRFYPLFSRLGVAALCVIARDGQLKGILTRKYITAASNMHVKTSRATVVKPFLCMESPSTDDNVVNAFSTPDTDASENGGEEGVSSLRDAAKQADDPFAEVSVIEMA
jgi:chloride channel 7